MSRALVRINARVLVPRKHKVAVDVVAHDRANFAISRVDAESAQAVVFGRMKQQVTGENLHAIEFFYSMKLSALDIPCGITLRCLDVHTKKMCLIHVP